MVHVLRHKVLVEGHSQRQVAKELGISRLTVRKYLTQAVPMRRETKPRARPVWDRVGTGLDALLAESPQWTAGKQQLTATRLHALLTHGPREAARRFAKILGELDVRGSADLVPALTTALATGTPLTLAHIVVATPPRVDVPTPLRDLEVASGCAADYDGWLTGART